MSEKLNDYQSRERMKIMVREGTFSCDAISSDGPFNRNIGYIKTSMSKGNKS